VSRSLSVVADKSVSLILLNLLLIYFGTLTLLLRFGDMNKIGRNRQ